MALLNGIDRGEAAKGVALGLGIAMVAPVIITSLLGASRPLARAAIKTGLIFYEKTRETFAEVAEVVEDLVAEAQAEVAEEHLRRADDSSTADNAVASTGAAAQRPATDNGVSS